MHCTTSLEGGLWLTSPMVPIPSAQRVHALPRYIPKPWWGNGSMPTFYEILMCINYLPEIPCSTRGQAILGRHPVKHFWCPCCSVPDPIPRKPLPFAPLHRQLQVYIPITSLTSGSPLYPSPD